MPAPTVEVATSVAEFIAKVGDTLEPGGDPNWYRGIGKTIEFNLDPGLFRHDIIEDAHELIKLERQMIAKFSRQSALVDVKIPPEELDTLVLMQHYGVKSRLLDWTTNPLIGLFFAVTSAPKDVATDTYLEDAAVWVLKPGVWNNKSLRGLLDRHLLPSDDGILAGFLPRKNDSDLEFNSMREQPATMIGMANKRLIAQSGVFVVFGSDTRPMETLYEQENYPPDCLVRIDIPIANIDDVRESILQHGFTESLAYPDFYGVALEINREAGFLNV